MKTLIAKNPLFYSFFLPAVTDAVVTIIGQDRSYWQNFKSVNEASPAYFVLAVNPIYFIFGSLLWFISLYFLILKLKRPWNLILSITFIAGHAWGSGGWITKLLNASGIIAGYERGSILMRWAVLILYFIIVGIAAAKAIELYFRNEKASE